MSVPLIQAGPNCVPLGVCAGISCSLGTCCPLSLALLGAFSLSCVYLQCIQTVTQHAISWLLKN